MPRMWMDYCQFLMDQCKITRTRRTFDRALQALPLTQHHRIWPLYIQSVRTYDLPETAVRVYRRYLKVRWYGEEGYARWALIGVSVWFSLLQKIQKSTLSI